MSHDHASCLGSSLRLSVWSAAQHGALCRLEELLGEDAARANKEDELRHTPLQLAALGGHLACVRLLLARGAEPGACAAGYNALHRACVRGHGEVVALLLQAPGGAAPALLELRDTGTGDGRTPLAKAAAGGHAAVVSQLLAAGADARPVDARGLSARALAEAAGHEEVVRLLPPDE